MKAGCVMLEAPAFVCRRVRRLQRLIAPESLTLGGLEHWPHVTLLYGITSNRIEKVIQQVRKIPEIDIEFGRVCRFHQPHESVLKINVESPALRYWREWLRQKYPVDSTFAKFSPHLTLAYVRHQASKSLMGNCELTGHTVRFKQAVVSIGGMKIKVRLAGV